MHKTSSSQHELPGHDSRQWQSERPGGASGPGNTDINSNILSAWKIASIEAVLIDKVFSSEFLRENGKDNNNWFYSHSLGCLQNHFLPCLWLVFAFDIRYDKVLYIYI